MKMLWFHLMPYTELPDDFRQTNPSVWVDIHSRLFDPERAHLMYNDFMDELEYAAAQGFDGICVNEHHANGYGLMPSPNLIATALARRTSNAALCILGDSLALYNPPLRVAEEMAMVDCISGGRVIAGFPVGSPMDTCYAYGQNPAMLRQRYQEAHDLIVKAWTTPEPFAFNGRFNQARYVNPWPRPLQRPHPPIWIPGGGSVETWHWCAEMDYVYCYLSFFGYKVGKATMDGFWSEMDRLGKDRNPYRAGFAQLVGVAESHDQAYRMYKDAAEYFYHRCLYVDPKYTQPPGHTTLETVRARARSGSNVKSSYERAGGALPSYDEMIEAGYIVIGNPEEVARQLVEVCEGLNCGHLMLLMQFGNMSREATMYNTRILAEQVKPRIHALFEEWEDRWWPQPMQAADRQRPARMAPAAE